MSPRGGKRKGSGRKATGSEKIRRNFNLDPDVDQIIRQQDKKSRFVNDAVRLKANAPSPASKGKSKKTTPAETK